jgi:hypothetical protein
MREYLLFSIETQFTLSYSIPFVLKLYLISKKYLFCICRLFIFTKPNDYLLFNSKYLQKIYNELLQD